MSELKILEFVRKSANLETAINQFKESNPNLWALVYVDPRDGLLTVSSDGRSHHEQIGIIEKAKLIVMYHRDDQE